MNNKRPVNLDIGTIHFPIAAIVSILHRISGVALFFATALLLWMFDSSLSSAEGFAGVKACLNTFWSKVVILLIFAGLAYHLAAGIRHLLMDCGVGESLEGGRLGAKIVVVSAIILTVLAGVWLW